jgi:hypothetical protein
VIAKRADDISRNLTFEPMDVKQSESFKASSLMPQKGRKGARPGIPMCCEILCKAEERGEFLCKLVVVEFARYQGMHSMTPATHAIFYRAELKDDLPRCTSFLRSLQEAEVAMAGFGQGRPY